MNAQKLKGIKAKYGLTSKQVADMLGVSYGAVVSWLRNTGSKNYRKMADRYIKHLQSELKYKHKI